jgi:sugar lactone lactonase YvrE
MPRYARIVALVLHAGVIALSLIATPRASAQTVTTLAGSGSAGYADGTGAAASFNQPTGLAIGPDGGLYVADSRNLFIRKVTPAGDVTTFVAVGSPGYYGPNSVPAGLAVDRRGFLYVVEWSFCEICGASQIKRVAPDRTVATLPAPSPVAVTVDDGGDVYVLDGLAGLRRVSPAFDGYTPGPGIYTAGSSGLAAKAGTFYIARGLDNVIWDLPAPYQDFSPVGSGKSALEDGPASRAAFRFPQGLAVDAAGNVYVADRDNHAIRRIGPDGSVTTLAGSGARGRADGVGRGATFDSPQGLALDGSGNLYVADTGNNLIRKIALEGSPAGQHGWIVPSVARVRGAGSSFWSSDLTLHNGSTSVVTATLRFLASGGDRSAAPSTSVALGPDQAVTISDVLSSAFGVSEGFGALDVSAPTELLAVRSRTSTRGAFGTVGDGIPGVPRDALFSGSAAPLLTGLREDEAFRSNLVLVNGAPVPITLVARASDDAGGVLGERTYVLPPFGMLQDFRFLRSAELGGAPRPSASVAVTSATPGSAFTILAAVIDNLSNDPTTVLPR